MHFVEITLKNLYNNFEEVTFGLSHLKRNSEAKQAAVCFQKKHKSGLSLAFFI